MTTFPAEFIEESIEFTIEKFSQVLRDEGIKANSFHISKILYTLQDRAKHLKIVSENFSEQKNTIFSSLEIYDSEVAYEIAKKLQWIAWIFSIVFLTFAVIEFLQRTF